MDNPRSRQSHAAKTAVNGMIVVGAATRVITRKASRTAGTWCASTHFLIGSSNGAVSLLKTSSPTFAQAAIAAVETPISRTVCDSSPRGRRRGRCAITGYVGTSSGQRPFSCQSLSRAKTAAHYQLSLKSFSRTRLRTCCPSAQIHRPVTWPHSSPLEWSRSQGLIQTHVMAAFLRDSNAGEVTAPISLSRRVIVGAQVLGEATHKN